MASVHPTVLSGLAVKTAEIAYETFASEQSEAYREVMNMRRAAGLPVRPAPDSDEFEMISRVFASALAILQFRLDSLPRGFLEGHAPPILRSQASSTLVVVLIDDDPRPHLLAIDDQVESLGTFAARGLTARPLCARVNGEGTFDLVAQDSDNVYGWYGSSSNPSMQWKKTGFVHAAKFASPEPNTAVTMVMNDGNIAVLQSDGLIRKTIPIEGATFFHEAVIWADPFHPADLCVIAISQRFDVVSQSLTKGTSHRSAEMLWNQLLFAEEDQYYLSYWYAGVSLKAAELEGFPCIVAERSALGGSAVHFLDPNSLSSLRPPLFLEGQVSSISLISGKWLIASFLQSGSEISPRIKLWDLSAKSHDALEGWLEVKGHVYEPVVLERPNGFEIIFVLQEFNETHERWLCRFRWPLGTIERLQRYSDLKLIGTDFFYAALTLENNQDLS